MNVYHQEPLQKQVGPHFPMPCCREAPRGNWVEVSGAGLDFLNLAAEAEGGFLSRVLAEGQGWKGCREWRMRFAVCVGGE